MAQKTVENLATVLIKGRQYNVVETIERLAPILTENRKRRIEEVISRRTYSVIPVLDGIYDRGNTSAVMRSSEAFGLQEFHIIETQEHFKVANRVTRGADKWLDIYKWSAPNDCVKNLKDKGYRIIATHLEAATPLEEIDFTIPTALVLGNEKEGVSQAVLEASDMRCIIPMQGFSQSFNISVAGAISFYHIYLDRIKRQGFHGDLTPEQKLYLTAKYYLHTVQNPEVYFDLN